MGPGYKLQVGLKVGPQLQGGLKIGQGYKFKELIRMRLVLKVTRRYQHGAGVQIQGGLKVAQVIKVKVGLWSMSQNLLNSLWESSFGWFICLE